MATYLVEAKIEGVAYVYVEAESEDEAIELSKASDGWRTDDWELNTRPHMGGYISATSE